MNNNHLHHVRIENFKSIKQVNFDCKRVNIFIGKPNVGKSNILEALGMLSNHSYLTNIVRYKKSYELFYDNDTSNNIKIYTDKLALLVTKHYKNSSFYHIVSNDEHTLDVNFEADRISAINSIIEQTKDLEDTNIPKFSIQQIDGFVNFISNSVTLANSNIRKYHYKSLDKYNQGGSDFLSAPFGDNIWNILNTNRKLREQVSELFVEYGLQFVMDLTEEKFGLQKQIDNFVYKYDYSLIADTLQRIIFHYAAIASNTNAVLLFEEPESHSYPGYIRDLGIEITYSETNQFFIATHSPYLLGTLMENLSYKDCAIFVCSYENYQTHVKELSEEEVREAIDYGQDLFMNIDSFVEHG